MRGNLQIEKTWWRLKFLQTFLLMIATCGSSQNLVLNPGFETVNQNALQCTGYQNAQSFSAAIPNWSWGSPGTSDIFSTTLPVTCNYYPLTLNPMIFGPQAPRTGNVMLGANMYRPVQNGSNLPAQNFACPGREYIQGTLSSPLVAGASYNISFYVSLSDNCGIACNNIGLKFSNTHVPVAGNTCILATPQVNYSGPPITDKTGWTKLEFCYTPAVSGQQYFTIGNFLDNVFTSTVSVPVSSQAQPGQMSFIGGLSYYFFDDISIVPVTALATAPVPAICSGSAAVLSVSGTGSYSWSPSAGLSSTTGSTVIAMPSVTTTYTVKEAGSLCPATGKVTVSVTPTPVLYVTASPASICHGDVTSLTVAGANSYTWSTGSFYPGITVSPQSSTIYSVSGTNGSCSTSATVEVGVMPATSLQVNAVAPVCYGQNTVLTATGGTHYNWLPSSGISDPNSPTVTVTPVPGAIYSVTATGPGSCPETKTLAVMVYPLPHADAGEDMVTTVDEPVTLYAKGNADVIFFLLPGATPAGSHGNSITVNPSETTCYVLRGINSYGCHHEDTVCVKVIENYSMYVPNTFSPDADGINDLFSPVCYGFKEIHFSVFNRWGTLIYSGNGNSGGWDGSCKGTPCTEGVYVYRIDAKTMAGIEVTRTGHVTLLTTSIHFSR